LTANYLIKKFQPKHADNILKSGEVENYKHDYPTELLDCEHSWTGFYLGTPIVCGGIYQMWDGVAEVWIITKQKQNKHKFFMLKNIKDKLETTIIEKKYHRVQAAVRTDFNIGLRFAKWFGMHEESIMKKFGPDKKDYYRLVRII